MAERKTPLITALQGQHLALVVAAHLARTQLVPDPLVRYDADHLMEMVEAAAQALIKVAPVYVQDGSGPRELSAAELDGAKVSDGGSLLVLKNGRRFTSASIKRVDLRQAIAILRAVGVPELEIRAATAPARDGAQTQAELTAQLAELEALLPHELARAKRLLVSLARNARDGRVANLAMQLMSAVHEGNAERIDILRAQLRALAAELEKTRG